MDNSKKLAIINAIPYGSTGKIVRGIEEIARDKSWETFIYYSWTKNYKKSDRDNIMVGSFLDKSIHIFFSKLTGYNGCFSFFDTWRLIRRLKKEKPDAINLHILHSWSVNLPMLFSYIKKCNIPVIWTMHDCWAFTGQCPHFVMASCDKWKTGCHDCPQYKAYPSAYVDRTKTMWGYKKKWFNGVKNLTVVTPSAWLSDLVKKSFLGEYPVKVIHNGIDPSVFQPRESDFREKYHCENKTVLLGVAFDWGQRKGLDVFVELAKRLDDTYRIVLVGTNDELDKQLQQNIISIHRTQNQIELAEIYSAADIFLNPTREDTYPTVNMESLACGTPVITFCTGGSPEILQWGGGRVCPVDDIDAFERAILEFRENPSATKVNRDDIIKQIDQKEKYREYLNLVTELVEA